MKSQQLSKPVKTVIFNNITKFVNNEFEKSEDYKKLKELKESIKEKVTVLVANKYGSDLPILEKYELVQPVNLAKFKIEKYYQESKNKVRAIIENQDEFLLGIDFSPLKVPLHKTYYHTHFTVEDLINDNPVILSETLSAYDINYNMQKIITSTIEAYKKRVDVFTSTKKLVEKHPEMETFIPNPEDKYPDLKKAEEILQFFTEKVVKDKK